MMEVHAVFEADHHEIALPTRWYLVRGPEISQRTLGLLEVEVSMCLSVAAT